MQVREVMNRPYIAEEDISLADAAKIMSSKRIGSLLYVIGGKVKGIITETDLIRNFGKDKKISQVMSKNIISVAPDETIEEVLKIMKDNKIKRVPVVDKDKNVVGVISMTDIAKNADKLEGEFFFN